jgi:hypothetical protein
LNINISVLKTKSNEMGGMKREMGFVGAVNIILNVMIGEFSKIESMMHKQN